MDLYTTTQVRAFDRAASLAMHIDDYDLMQRAAAAAWAYAIQRWPRMKQVSVICGAGNNGGDGYCFARQAQQAGLQVSVSATAMPRSDTVAAKACADWLGTGAQILSAESVLTDADLYVDAIFGIGLTRKVVDAELALIKQINSSGRPVLALDVPSGIDADSGSALGAAVRATATVTFIAQKRGLFTGAATAHCGEVILATLGVPDPVFAAQSADANLLNLSALATYLPRRARDAHKGKFGHVLAIGGDNGMGGAIRLCAEAALRTGAGLVSVATQAGHVPALNAARPELMAHGVSGTQEIESLLQRASVIALGPGLGQRAWGHALWHTAIASGKPMVVDADALSLLALEPIALPSQVVLTPHPGEAARLLGCASTDIEADRFTMARELARHYSSVVVLKGAGSLIATPQGDVAVCPWGNPGMASGGMGDVLTGVIAGLLAQGLDPWHAARAGVALHARAGDAASASGGEAGLLASDLFGPLRMLRNECGSA